MNYIPRSPASPDSVEAAGAIHAAVAAAGDGRRLAHRKPPSPPAGPFAPDPADEEGVRLIGFSYDRFADK